MKIGVGAISFIVDRGSEVGIIHFDRNYQKTNKRIRYGVGESQDWLKCVK